MPGERNREGVTVPAPNGHPLEKIPFAIGKICQHSKGTLTIVARPSQADIISIALTLAPQQIEIAITIKIVNRGNVVEPCANRRAYPCPACRPRIAIPPTACYHIRQAILI